MKKYINSILTLPTPVKRFLLTELLYGVAYAVWNLLYNFHLSARGFSIAQITLVSSLGLALTAVLSLAAGHLCDRAGFRPAMVIGCLFRAAGIAATAALPGTVSIYLGQMLFSIGTALILSSEFPFILSLVGRESGNLVYNLLLCVANLGMLAGYVAAGLTPGWIPDGYYKYSPVLLASGVFFALIGITRGTLPNKPATAAGKPGSLKPLADRKTLLFSAYGALGSVVFSLVASMANIVYRSSFHLSDSDVGFTYSLLAVVSCASYFTAPLITKKFGAKKTAAAALSLAITGLVVMSFAGTGFFIVLWLLFFFLNSLLAGTVDSAMLHAIPDGSRGAYSGVRVFANNIGFGAGTALSGLILSHSGYPLIMLAGAALTVLQLVVLKVKCEKMFA